MRAKKRDWVGLDKELVWSVGQAIIPRVMEKEEEEEKKSALQPERLQKCSSRPCNPGDCFSG